ncbi:unnamed protein product [Amoebophrya sp. A120]|nr:unnamed protein product [Amoebophrya sp. A120]|eukprot:GSA120T00019427001.1
MSQELFTWGSGAYGRLGLGGLEDHGVPQRLGGICNGRQFANGSCGWYHSACVTTSGEVLMFGTNVTGCLGLVATNEYGSFDKNSGEISGYNSFSSDTSSSGSDDEDESDDELLQQSDDDYTELQNIKTKNKRLERKKRKQALKKQQYNERTTETFVPKLLKISNKLNSQPSRKMIIVQVSCGGDMLGAHTLALTQFGRLYSWGYGPATGLGKASEIVRKPTLVKQFYGFASNSGKYVEQIGHTNGVEEIQRGFGSFSRKGKWLTKALNSGGARAGLQMLSPRIVKISAGGSFSIALSYDGQVFTWGLSAGGRLGFRTRFRAQLKPRRLESVSLLLQDGGMNSSASVNVATSMGISTSGSSTQLQQNIFNPLSRSDGEYAKIIDIAAGNAFGLLLSGPNSGSKVFAFGENSKGQLGVGHLMDCYEPTMVFSSPFGQKTSLYQLSQIACGDAHSLALDMSGNVYSWGALGGPATGHGFPNPNALVGGVSAVYSRRKLDLQQYKLYLEELEKEEKMDGEGTPTSSSMKNRNIADPVARLNTEEKFGNLDGMDNFGQMVSLSTQFRLRSVPFWWTRPRNILHLNNVVQIQAGFAHSMALTKDGLLYQWGTQPASTAADANFPLFQLPPRTTLPGTLAGYFHNEEQFQDVENHQGFTFTKMLRRKLQKDGKLYGYDWIGKHFQEEEDGGGNGGSSSAQEQPSTPSTSRNKLGSGGSSSSSLEKQTNSTTASSIASDMMFGGASNPNATTNQTAKNLRPPAQQQQQQVVPRGSAKITAVSKRAEAYWIPRLVNFTPHCPLLSIENATAGGWHSMGMAKYETFFLKNLAVGKLNEFCDGYLKCRGVNLPVCSALLEARLKTKEAAAFGAWEWVAAQIVSKRELNEEETLCDMLFQQNKKLYGASAGSNLNLSTSSTTGGHKPLSMSQPVSVKSYADSPASINYGASFASTQSRVQHFQLNSADDEDLSPRSNSVLPGNTNKQARPKEIVFTSSSEDESDKEVTASSSRGPQSGGGRSRSGHKSARSSSKPPRIQKKNVPAVPDFAQLSAAVVATFLHFIYMDRLEFELIDDDDEAFVVEEASGPDGTRANERLLIYDEVVQLKALADRLGIDRLANLVEQKLLQIVEPAKVSSSGKSGSKASSLTASGTTSKTAATSNLPPLFVAASDLHAALRRLFLQTFDRFRIYTFLVHHQNLANYKIQQQQQLSSAGPSGDIVSSTSSSSMNNPMNKVQTKSLIQHVQLLENEEGFGSGSSAASSSSLNCLIQCGPVKYCPSSHADKIFSTSTSTALTDTILAAHAAVLVGECEGGCNLVERSLSEEIKSPVHRAVLGDEDDEDEMDEDAENKYYFLDVSDTPLDVVFTGLSFLYTQEFADVAMPFVRPPVYKDENQLLEQFFYNSEELWNSLDLVSTEYNNKSNSDDNNSADYGASSSSRKSPNKMPTILTKEQQLEKAINMLDTYRTKFMWPQERKISFFLDLFTFAVKINAVALKIYTEDVLIGLLADNCWADMWVFADEIGSASNQLTQQKEALKLKEAAIQFGLRQIAPFAFLRFFGKNVGKRNKNFVDNERKRNVTLLKNDKSVVDPSLTTQGDATPRNNAKGNPSGTTKQKTPETASPSNRNRKNKSGGGKKDTTSKMNTSSLDDEEEPTELFFSHQSQWFKSNALEKFLFDLDLPHISPSENWTPILQEHFNSNLMQEVKKRRPVQWNEFKERLVQLLVEFEKVEYNLDLILSKSVFHNDNDDLQELFSVAKKGFSSFFFKSTGKVPEKVVDLNDANAINKLSVNEQNKMLLQTEDDSITKEQQNFIQLTKNQKGKSGKNSFIIRSREKILPIYLLAKYFWEFLVLLVAIFMYRYRDALQDRILLVNAVRYFSTEFFANAFVSTAEEADFLENLHALRTVDIMIRNFLGAQEVVHKQSDLPVLLRLYDYFTLLLTYLHSLSVAIKLNPYFVIMAFNAFLIISVVVAYVKYV